MDALEVLIYKPEIPRRVQKDMWEKIVGKFYNKMTVISGLSISVFIPDICHFITEANFLENKIYTKKRVNYDKIHSKLPIFCVITAKYTVNCQFFALNL